MSSDYELPSLYFAAPLFSDAELTFNSRICDSLERWFDVYLPQRDGGLVADLVSKGVSVSAAYESIFARDVVALKNADVCLIVMDGRSVDEGAAFELGYANARGTVCIGFQTDIRRLLPLGNNPMIQCALTEHFTELKALLDWVQQFSIEFQAKAVHKNR